MAAQQDGMISTPRPAGVTALLQGSEYIYGSLEAAALMLGGDLQRLKEVADETAARRGELDKM